MNLFLKKNCNHCVNLIERMQENNIPTDDVNIYIYGNDDFPLFISRTPTIVYNNYPYVGRKAFELIERLKREDPLPETEEVNQNPPRRTSEPSELKTSSNQQMSQSLDGFGALYDTGNHVMLTETGFDETLVDLGNLKEEEKSDFDLQKLIDSRNEDIARLAPPKP